jgi:hypothetical protein
VVADQVWVDSGYMAPVVSGINHRVLERLKSSVANTVNKSYTANLMIVPIASRHLGQSPYGNGMSYKLNVTRLIVQPTATLAALSSNPSGAQSVRAVVSPSDVCRTSPFAVIHLLAVGTHNVQRFGLQLAVRLFGAGPHRNRLRQDPARHRICRVGNHQFNPV